MRPGEGYAFPNIAATTSPFNLIGGTYGVDCIAGAWNSGTVNLQRLAGDGATWVNAAEQVDLAGLVSFNANLYANIPLAPGSYRFDVSAATGVYVTIVRIPGE